MYDIAICDDDSRFVGYMERMLLKSGLAEGETAFHEFHSGEELVQSCSQRPKIDLLILDIKMEGMDGNGTARLFRSYFPSSVLVFCSGVYKPTVESFEAEPYRYLLKAYSDERMEKELQAVIQEMKKRQMEAKHGTAKAGGNLIYFYCKGRQQDLCRPIGGEVWV